MKKIFYNTDGESVSVIRFYSNNEVIGSSFTNLNKLDENFLKMFDKNTSMSYLWSKGVHEIIDNKLSFSLKSKYATIKYTGELNSNNELILHVESLSNGHKSIKRYSPINQFPKRNEQVFVTKDFYPTILIPNKISTAILNNISDKDLYKSLNIDIPKLKKIDIPSKPNPYKYVKKEKTEYVGDGCIGIASIPVAIIFVIMFIYSIGKAHIALTVFFLIGAIGQISYLFNFKSKIIEEKIYLTDEEYEKLKKKYTQKLEQIRKENIKLEEEYYLKKKNIELNIKNKKVDYALKEYLKTLRVKSNVIRHNKNIKRGKTELMFLDMLYKKFGDQIKVDIYPSCNSKFYFPDFVFICKKTGLHIDIEIDEPYSFSEKKPIHHTESDDEDRNTFFLENNWVVIRFSERQVIQQTEKCLEVIENTILALHKKSEEIKYTLKQDNRWTYEEALVMSYNNIRNEY
ncbi:hypothetical protein [Mesoflavibacter zeaxanthinifaciens]|uniref:hypothetical protein n=1 Tax=Mesoflavibacter zeaxanthinifaciens TaxID=393060 RepID=UPI0026EF3CE6|nr:hypothetical protein [Mesoflavibacter zeaxanthinifaciens]